MNTLRIKAVALLAIVSAFETHAQMLTAPGSSAGPLDKTNNNYSYLTLGSWASSGGNDYRIGVDSSTMWFGAWESYRWYRTSNGGLDMTLKQGSLGIGTGSPMQKLHVVGDILAEGSLHLWGGSPGVQVQYINQSDPANQRITELTQNDGEFFARFVNDAYSAADNWLRVKRNPGTYSVSSVNFPVGRVGVGTIDPNSTFTVKRDIGANEAQIELGPTGMSGSSSSMKSRLRFRSTFDNYTPDQDPRATAQLEAGYAGGAWDSEYLAFQVGGSDNGGAAPIERARITAAGNVGIGTTNPTHKLSVNGTIQAKEIVVETGWADYVFEKDYRLAPLAEVEAHIEAVGHLPGIPSAAQVAKEGVSMGEMQARMMAKIEELTLHLISQEKRIRQLETENAALRPTNH